MKPVDESLTTFESLGLKTDRTPMEEKKLGQEDFMKLMMTQLNSQDPFKPMEDGEFLSQMAQFSAVSGLKDIKDSFKSLSESMQSNQSFQAASMVGRKVLVSGKNAELIKGQDLIGTVDLKVPTEELIITVKDKSGMVIKEINMGKQAAGKIDFKWDGKVRSVDANDEFSSPDYAVDSADTTGYADAGKYEINAYITVDNEKQAVDTMVFDRVESVLVGNASQPMMLNLSSGDKVKMSEVYKIM